MDRYASSDIALCGLGVLSLSECLTLSVVSHQRSHYQSLKGPKGILADDIADSKDFDDSSDSAFAAPPMTLTIVVTLPLLLKICSKRWSHCPETIVTIGTGTLSVAKEESPKVDDRDVDHRRFSVFDLKDLSDLNDFKDTIPCSRGANVP